MQLALEGWICLLLTDVTTMIVRLLLSDLLSLWTCGRLWGWRLMRILSYILISWIFSLQKLYLRISGMKIPGVKEIFVKKSMYMTTVLFCMHALYQCRNKSDNQISQLWSNTQNNCFFLVKHFFSISRQNEINSFLLKKKCFLSHSSSSTRTLSWEWICYFSNVIFNLKIQYRTSSTYRPTSQTTC